MAKELTKKMIDTIRLQMLYNISNGWSWYAYKKLGSEGIIDVELDMWDKLMRPAVDLFTNWLNPKEMILKKPDKYLLKLVKLTAIFL
jgi:hypothetical protein